MTTSVGLIGLGAMGSGMQARLAALRILYIDAPISGGTARAASGEMTMMSAGKPEAYAAAEPYLRAMAGTLCKVAQTIAQYGARGTPIRAVMLPRLGPNVWAADPMQAMAVLEELEETAQLACLQPDTAPLTQPHIEELRTTFGAIW